MRDFIAELRRRNVLRVAVAYLATAWLAVQVLETIFPIFDLPAIYIRWIIIALAILLLPVLAMAWAFEWSAGSLRSQESADSMPAHPSSGSRRFDKGVIAVLALALLYFAADKFLLPRLFDAGVGPDTAIAVLPFTDLTQGAEGAYLGTGLAEDLLNLLSRNPAVRVAARRSSFSFRDSDQPVAEIARQLAVSHVLDGSIRKLGDRLRINVELVSAVDGYSVWSEVFDRRLDELVTVKSAILDSVEKTLDVAATSAARADAPPDPEAYVLFLRANYLSGEGSRAGREQAVTLFRQALQIDPGFAMAWTNLSTTCVNQVIAGQMDFHEGYRQAREAALNAIDADPGHAGGYKALSFINRYFEGNMPLAIANMQRALERDPSNIAVLEDAGTLLMNAGQLEDAVRVQEYIVKRSPVDVISWWNLGLRYRYSDRLEASERAYRRVLELNPEKSEIHYNLAETLLLAGRYAEALDLFRAEADEAYRLKGLALAQHALGNREESDLALARLIEGYGEQWPSEVAHVYAYRGEADSAFEWLEREYDKYGPGGWGEWQLQRLYDKLREDPRWQAFLARTGTSAEQLASLELRVPDSLFD